MLKPTTSSTSSQIGPTTARSSWATPSTRSDKRLDNTAAERHGGLKTARGQGSMGGGEGGQGARAPPTFRVRGHAIQNAPQFLVITILFFIAVLK